MYTYILSALLMVSCSLVAVKSDAQVQNDSSKVTERIILKKKGVFPQDLTIHIHGDKITINGKKPKGIDVIREKSSDKKSLFKSFHQGNDGGGFSPHSFRFGAMQGGRPLLGVLTKRGDDSDGARVADVEKGTAADSAGLEQGDVIIKIDDHEIGSAEDLSRTIGQYRPGSDIVVTYLRDGQQKETDITLGRIGGAGGVGGGAPSGQFGGRFGGQMPPEGGNIMDWFRKHHPGMMNGQPHFKRYSNSKGKLGVVVENHQQPEGVKVVHVSPRSVAAKAGFKENDIVTKFGKKSIHTIQDLKDAIHQNQSKKEIKVIVFRNGNKETLTVSFHQAPERAQL